MHIREVRNMYRETDLGKKNKNFPKREPYWGRVESKDREHLITTLTEELKTLEDENKALKKLPIPQKEKEDHISAH